VVPNGRLVILFLALLGFGPILWLAWSGKPLFAPWALLCISQFGGMAISLLKLMPAMTDPATMTWFVFFGFNFSYLLGYAFAIKATRNLNEQPRPPQEMSRNQAVVFLGISAIFYMTVIASRFAAGSWPIFAANPEASRIKFFSANLLINFTIQFSYSTAAFSAWMIFRAKSGLRRIAWICWGLIPVVFILAVARNMILFSLFSLLFYFELWKRPLKVRWAVLFCVLFIGMFLATGLAREGIAITKALSFVGKGTKVWVFAFKPVYMYVANNFWNLDYGIQLIGLPKGQPFTFGYTSLSGISYYLNGGRFETAFGLDGFLNESTSKVPGLNTVSYQWTLFKDFGYVIPCFILFLIGAWSARIYSLALKNKTASSAYFALFASFWALYSLFIFGPVAPQNIIYLAIGLFFLPVLRNKNHGAKQE
jgi:oligosaccharide repeat unit polymerase